ncbi:MAG: rimI [Verrucomicrobiaceae bacterium]|nr:rimI [Verrucomicrobiaceae bacterium]
MLRELTVTDAPTLFAIESLHNPFPWSLRQFHDSFAMGDFGWGLERANLLIGFILFSQVLDETTLLNLVIHPQWRRRGFARQLLIQGLRQLEQAGAVRCLLEVRVSNFNAIELYSLLGFEVDGKRRDYYPAANGREDALLMSRFLPFREEV